MCAKERLGLLGGEMTLQRPHLVSATILWQLWRVINDTTLPQRTRWQRAWFHSNTRPYYVVAPRPSECNASADELAVPVPLAGSLSETLCGSSRPMGVFSVASSQLLCNTQETRSTPICTDVVSLAQHWLTLNMASQDIRVSRCLHNVLEIRVNSLCELSKRHLPAYLTRSCEAMAGKIGEIFRATMRAIVGRATSRALAYILPFVVDSSSPYMHNINQFKAHLEDLFGPEIYHSLTDPSYRGHWNHVERSRRRVSNAAAVKLLRVSTDPSNPPPHIRNDRPRRVLKASTLSPVLDWPQPVPTDVVKQCCKDYRDATSYKRPDCCAVCGREQMDAKIFHQRIQREALPEWLEILRIPAGSPFLDSCNDHSDVLRNIMLCPKGVMTSDNGEVATVLRICDQCRSSLFSDKPRLPKFALAN
jgi:hypothetical protein